MPRRTVVITLSIAIATLWSSSPAGRAQVSPPCPTDAIGLTQVLLGGISLSVGCQGHVADVKPTLIFLHGFPEYWSAWEKVASLLASKFTVVLPDQRGYNLSDKPLDPAAYELGTLVSDVAGLIDAFSPGEPVVLVGHDLGGLVAYVAASQLPPGRIGGLVIANAPHPNVYQQLFLMDLAKLPAVEGQVAASAYIPTFFPSATCPLDGLCPYAIPEEHYSNPDKDGDLDDPDLVDYANLIQLVGLWGGASIIDQELLDAWNRTPSITPQTHLTSLLNWYRALVPLLFSPLPDFRIEVPTLVLWGEQDVTLVEANVAVGNHPAYPGVQTLDRFVPDLQIRLFPDSGHFIQHEQPVEVASEIKKFVDRIFAHSRAQRD